VFLVGGRSPSDSQDHPECGEFEGGIFAVSECGEELEPTFLYGAALLTTLVFDEVCCRRAGLGFLVHFLATEGLSVWCFSVSFPFSPPLLVLERLLASDRVSGSHSRSGAQKFFRGGRWRYAVCLYR